jgi:hypothetical protein
MARLPRSVTGEDQWVAPSRSHGTNLLRWHGWRESVEQMELPHQLHTFPHFGERWNGSKTQPASILEPQSRQKRGQVRYPHAVSSEASKEWARDSPEEPTQNPAIIAGLRRIATSLWLHFVASPQRVPAFGYRRRSQPVVNLIDKLSPGRFQRHRQCLAVTNSKNTWLRGVLRATQTPTRDVPPTRADL